MHGPSNRRDPFSQREVGDLEEGYRAGERHVNLCARRSRKDEV